MQNIFRPILLIASLFPFVLAATETTLESIIDPGDEPSGVVIEIVTGDDTGLSWALPKAQRYIKQLRQRFPNLHIAIVTHGREQFALQKNKQGKQKKVHSLTKILKKDNVQLHVCGTYAGWRGLSDEDFPDYVNVAAAGPAQINDYLALGYKLLVIRKPD